jgi:MYXO-CTERM domain-containing protein
MGGQRARQVLESIQQGPRAPSLGAKLRWAVPVVGILLVSLAGLGEAQAAPLPPTPVFGPKIDPFVSYDAQDTCSPSAKPGTQGFHDFILKTYPKTGDFGIVRACNIGGTSEHKEGRAWDWKVYVSNPAHKDTADTVIKWLLKTDQHGNACALARRHGLMYFIWNKRIWGGYRAPNSSCASAGWKSYTGSNPHTDHVHLSWGWAGAKKQTSWWTEAGPVEKTLKASLTQKWSNAKRYRGKSADYIACSGKPVKYKFTFKNKGTATWRDVKGRGSSVGSDVFLVTTSGTKDKLSGKTRFSVNRNKNNKVRGDRKAGNCSGKPGCRKTTFIDGAIQATAPKKPGVYRSSWRLRDYSKTWGKESRGFGPKVELKLRVKDCSTGQCGCWVWCTDGSKKKVAAEGSSAQCKATGMTMCEPAKYLAHQYTPCESASSGGSGGTSSGGTSSGGTSSGGTSSGGTSSGGTSAGGTSAGGTSSGGTSAGGTSSGGSSGETGGGWGEPGAEEGDEGDPNGTSGEQLEDEHEQDDEQFEEDGFNGDEEGIEAEEPAPESGEVTCAVSSGRSSAAGSWMLLAAAVAVLRRRRRRSNSRKA